MKQNELLVKHYRDGMRPVDIARELGVTEWTIHHRLNRSGESRRPIGMTQAAIERAVSLRQEGMSYNQLGPLLGYSPTTVAKEVRSRGVN